MISFCSPPCILIVFLFLTQNIPKRTSLNTKRTCDDEDDDEDEEDDDDDDDDDDERYRYDQRSNMFKF